MEIDFLMGGISPEWDMLSFFLWTKLLSITKASYIYTISVVHALIVHKYFINILTCFYNVE